MMPPSQDKLPPALHLNPDQDHVVQSTLQQWVDTSMIPSDLASQLLSTIQVSEKDDGFDWRKFSKYAFRLAAFCLILAIVTLLYDELFTFLQHLLFFSAPVRCVLTGAIATVVHAWGFFRQVRFPEQTYRNEAIHAFGVVLLALYALQAGEALNVTGVRDTYKVEGVLGSLMAIYGVLAFFSKSNFVLSCMFLVSDLFISHVIDDKTEILSEVFADELDVLSVYVIYGVVLVVSAYLMRKSRWTNKLWSTTRIWGLLHTFIGLLVLSILSPRDWVHVYWIALFVLAAVNTWHGLRFGDATTKGFGLTFIVLNLLAQSAWDLWNDVNGPIFFVVVAILLGVLGRFAESVWILGVAYRENKGRVMLV